MTRRLAHLAFYLLLLVSGEEFEGLTVDLRAPVQDAAQRA